MRRSPESASLSDDDRSARGRPVMQPRHLRPRWHRSILSSVGCWLLVTTAAAAQNANFVTPGSSNRSVDIPEKQQILDRVDEAPWRTGIFRFSPWLGIRDASLVTGTRIGDGTEDTEDFTATIGAGLRGYIRTGDNVLIAGHVLPEYTWWADDEDRRRLNGRYGLGIFVFLNRLDIELSHRIREQQTFFSPEVRRLTPVGESISRALFTVELGSRFNVALRGTRIEATSEEDDGPFAGFLSQLDRTEETIQALIGYNAPRGWHFALGIEDRSADFDSNARPLSNRSDGIRFEAGLTGNRFDGLLELSFTDIEPDGVSGVREASETTGALEGIWTLTERSALFTYARRTLNYSISGGASYFIGERFGLRWQASLPKVGFGLWAESGDDTFSSLLGSDFERVDDVVSLGAEVNISLRAIQLRLEFSHSDYSSPIADLDRDVTTLGFSVQIEPLEKLLRSAVDRLKFGSSAGLW